MLFIGSYDRNLVPLFKRTAQYTVEDYELAARLFAFFTKVVTTPAILTEESNLAGQLSGELKPRFFTAFARGLILLEEHYIPSVEIARLPEFARFGLTDATIRQIAQAGYLVLTNDFRLAGYLDSTNIPALNFNHLRQANLFR
jgi:hypothetical protein